MEKQPDQDLDVAIAQAPNQQTAIRFRWSDWKTAERVVFVAACMAAISLLMKWYDIGFTSGTSFSAFTFWWYGLFAYPLRCLLKGQAISKAVGISSGVVGVVFSIIYINSKAIEIAGRSMNVAGPGVLLFALASIILIAASFFLPRRG